jgi:hypothetical protein
VEQTFALQPPQRKRATSMARIRCEPPPFAFRPMQFRHKSQR